LEALLRKVGLPTGWPDVDPDEVIRILSHDKKVRDGKVHFVLPERIGKVVIRDDVDPGIIRKALAR
jgi:3-dehydroquinate synthase